MQIREVEVRRYITPLREGGSLPAIVEANDGYNYVLKFRGAGQGVKALIAEFIGGELARYLGFRVPEMVFAKLDEAFGRTEPDEEIQDLLRASEGINLGVHHLSGAFTYDPVVTLLSTEVASGIVWFDSLITNVDRTARNTNMLMWHKELWLIDHGAAFYFHHNILNWQESATKSFPQIKDHVLLPFASQLDMINDKFSRKLSIEVITEIVNQIPEDWLIQDRTFDDPQIYRDIYINFLMIRLQNTDIFLNGAKSAREILI